MLASGLNKIILKPILEYGQRLLQDMLVVEKIVSENEFIVYHEELRTQLTLKQISSDENLDRWCRVQTHTNVAGVFH